MKYIDAERLRAEIERLRVWLKSDEAAPFVEAYLIGGEKALTSIEDFLDSLQQKQPEVDLDKKTIIDYVHNHYHYDKDFDGYGHSNLRPVFTREDLTEFARHFYELGLKSK